MDNRVMKVFVACALGAGIGSVVALGMNQYLWWLGMLVGGLIGYLAYEFKQVIKAVPVAYRKTTVAMFSEQGFRVVLGLCCGVLLASSIFLSFLIPYVFIPGQNDQSVMASILGLGITYVAMYVLYTLTMALIYFTLYTDEKGKKLLSTKQLLKCAFWVSPLGVCAAVLLGLFLIARYSPKVSLSVVKFCTIFTKNLFMLIHSDIRLLCAVDAVIGAGVGYFTSSPIIGALVGGAVGVANYEILSRRILHLVPRR